MINLIKDLEYSIILFLLYVIIRSATKNKFRGEDQKGTSLIIVVIGIAVILLVNTTIGIIMVIIGLTILIIPEKKKQEV